MEKLYYKGKQLNFIDIGRKKTQIAGHRFIHRNTFVNFKIFKKVDFSKKKE